MNGVKKVYNANCFDHLATLVKVTLWDRVTFLNFDIFEPMHLIEITCLTENFLGQPLLMAFYILPSFKLSFLRVVQNIRILNKTQVVLIKDLIVLKKLLKIFESLSDLTFSFRLFWRS